MINSISENSFVSNKIINVIYNKQLFKITSVACYVLKKFTLALALNIAIRCAFSAFLIPQASVIATAVAFLTAFVITKIAQYYFKNASIPIWMQELSLPACATSLSFRINNFIHEYGHYIAARLSFIDAKPEVFVNYNQGATSYIISNGLTRFGRFLGEQRALLFITAAGLMTPIFCTIAEFAMAHGLYDSCPDLSEFFIDHGFSQLASAFYYGASAFFSYEGQLENDFILLWQIGEIHPLISITLMLAVPLAEICLFKYLEQK